GRGVAPSLRLRRPNCRRPSWPAGMTGQLNGEGGTKSETKPSPSLPCPVRQARLLEVAPDGEELVAALPPYGFAVEPLQFAKRIGDGLAGRCNGGGRIAVGAADRFGDDAVDDTECGKVGRGDLHVGGGVLRLGGVAPQDRGRALRR